MRLTPIRLFHALVAAALTALPAGATDVSGTIATNTVWTTNGSPYTLTAHLNVATNATLTINPGVNVRVSSGCLLTVYGTLLAEGTAAAPVVFGPPPAQANGGGLRFSGSGFALGSAGVLRHCEFSRMLYGTAAMLSAQYARLTVTDCHFSDIPATVMRPVDSRVEIRRSNVHNSHEGMNLVRCAGLVSSNNVHHMLGDWDGIDLDAYWTGPGDASLALLDNFIHDGNDDGIDVNFNSVLLRGNIISNFTDKGISLGLGGSAPADLGPGSVALIENNLILQCDIGIAIKDRSNPRIAHVTIAECNYGIRSYEKVDGAGLGSATNCIIWNCGVSIELLNGSVLGVGQCAVAGASVWPGPANLNAYPEFAAPLAHDYRLMPGSPCLDAGVVVPWLSGTNDLARRPRAQGQAPDIGAFEYQPDGLTCNATATNRVGVAPPFAVVFQAHVVGTNLAGLAYTWDFDGDGTPERAGAGMAVVTNVYTIPGWYTVAMSVSNAAGERASVTKASYILVQGPPVVYVAATGAHVFPYTNWASAATNVGAALAVAFEGARVLVSNGVYRLPGELRVQEAVTLTGVGGAAATVLDAGGASRCLLVTHAGATVEGFTLRGGRAADGGGVRFEAEALLRHCVVTGNVAEAAGGGVYFSTGGRAEDCLIAGNVAATSGGGVYMDGGGAIDRCELRGNRATAGNGGGACCNWIGTLRNAIIRDNTAGGEGGGVYGWYGGAIENCTVTANAAATGGGLRLYRGGSVANTINYFNTAPAGTNESNEGVFSYTHNCSSPLPAGDGNVDGDPRFMDPASGDLRLQPDSPCLNAGTNLAWMAGATDFAGASRILAERVDMGALEAAVTPPMRLYVSNGGADAYPYATWRNAATSLAAAVSAAPEGATIVVSNGTLRLAAEVVLSRAVTVQGLGDAAATVLSGGGAVRCLRLDHPLAVVTGVTLTAGLAAQGGGVYMTAGALRGCRIVGNRATDEGGGAFVTGGVLAQCVVSNNASTNTGGGIFLSYGGAVVGGLVTKNRARAAAADAGGIMCVATGLVDGCTVTANTAGDDGGGIMCGDNNGVPGGTVRGCVVRGNSAGAGGSNYGGGLMLWPGAVADNCLVTGNHAGLGGGIAFRGGGLARHGTVVGNSAVTRGGGAWVHTAGGTAENTIFWANTAPTGSNCYSESSAAVYRHCCAAPLPAGSGNIATNPALADAPQDLHLSPGSPCIDAGTNRAAVAVDAEGTPRPLDGNADGTARPDIGACEFLNATADTDGDGMPDGWERAQGLALTTNDASADADGDAFANLGEYVAGTSPHDPAQWFRIAGFAAGGAQPDAVLSWLSVTQRRYRVYAAPGVEGNWTNVLDVPGRGGWMQVTSPATAAPRLYRLGVRVP